MAETHTHVDEFGNVYTHSHEDGARSHGTGEEHTHSHGHGHTHTHDPKAMKAIINRLSRSIGHMESVKRMIENGQDCADVLVQLAAVRSEINNAGKALLKEHLDHCIVEAVQENDQESIDKMNAAIDKFMK
ncbi:MAG: metal-sensing transcriptional repressor [Lachnospiraceae bacterium]|nr:metal-sensing transcriptional repressor [Lachnospiraceae bacterium]